MQHPEILAPVGSRESLEAAFAAGADAIYFGLPNFGARAYANRFTLEETQTIIERAHLMNVKVYITMNTILFEEEMEEAYQQAKALYESNVDALIVQDLGLLHLLHHRLPDLELHASTQLSVNHPDQIEQLKKLGVKRVVLARECTLKQIKACVATGVEIEVFIHGALCISYSGQCQFSAVEYGRSGNRGQCAQPCRMPYTLLEEGKEVKSVPSFLISPKDLSLIHDLKDLQDLNVASLKIEGRMKSAEYVYEAVSATKKALEGNALSPEEEQRLKVTFNRTFTKGHAYEQKGNDLMEMKASNHHGIDIGTVIASKGKKITIQLQDDLSQNDGIRFEKGSWNEGCRINFLYDQKGRLINQGKAKETVVIDGPLNVKVGSRVKKTIDSKLQDEVEAKIKSYHRQIEIKGKVWCKGIGEPLVLELFDGKNAVVVKSEELAQEALKQVSDQQTISKQLNKTNTSWARFATLEFDLAPNIYFSLKTMNQLRQQGMEQLKQKHLSYSVQEEKAYTYCPQIFDEPMIVAQIEEESQKGEEDVVWISENPLGVSKLARLNEPKGFVVTHLGQGDIIINMNVSNSYAVAALLELGYKKIGVSDEMDKEQLFALIRGFEKRYHQTPPILPCIYQKRRLMIMKHCPINTLLKDGKRIECRLCHEREYILKGKDGRKYLMKGDSACNMRLFRMETSDRLDWVPELRKAGIDSFLCIFIDEKKDKISQVLKALDNSKTLKISHHSVRI